MKFKYWFSWIIFIWVPMSWETKHGTLRQKFSKWVNKNFQNYIFYKCDKHDMIVK